MLVALAIPVVVESLQLVVLQGVASIDDVILNALGVVIGWLLGKAVVVTMIGWHGVDQPEGSSR